MISLICGIQKTKQMNKLNKNRKQDYRYREKKKQMVATGFGCGRSKEIGKGD